MLLDPSAGAYIEAVGSPPDGLSPCPSTDSGPHAKPAGRTRLSTRYHPGLGGKLAAGNRSRSQRAAPGSAPRWRSCAREGRYGFGHHPSCKERSGLQQQIARMDEVMLEITEALAVTPIISIEAKTTEMVIIATEIASVWLGETV
jgi:hypothetical protein